jgi:CDP-ribitol ribitolphosphotransferase
MDFEEEKVAQYVEHHFDYIDSNASDRVIDWLILGNIPADIKADIDAVDEANRNMNNMTFEIFDEDLADDEDND